MSVRRVRATFVAVAMSTVVAFGVAAPASAAPAVPVVVPAASSGGASVHLSGRDPFPKLAPVKILAKATTAAKTAKTVRVHMVRKTEDDVVTVDATVTKTAGQAKVVTGKSGTCTIIRYGKELYILGDFKFWVASLADSEDKTDAANALASRWIGFANSPANLKDYRELTALGYWVTDLTTFRPTKRVKGKAVKGKATVGLADEAGVDGFTFYVAAAGVPYPLLVEANDKTESIVFSDWNRAMKVNKPGNAIMIPASGQ